MGTVIEIYSASGAFRDGPFNAGNRDILLVVEKWLKSGPGFPPVQVFKTIFEEINEGQWQHISNLSFCTTNVIKLKNIQEKNLIDAQDLKYIKDSILLYTLEAQRMLGSLFDLKHRFWISYYNRISSTFHLYSEHYTTSSPQNGLFLLPLDVIHELTGKRYSLEFEMISQSIQAVLTAHDPTVIQEDRVLEHYNRALRIVRNIHMEGYELWIRNLLTTQS